ncbi:hypothetical protein KCU64_g2214, partial [Aureobasidium melanogenum]
MFTNITLHEQFAAAMIICLDLNESTPQSAELRARKFEALQKAQHFWSTKKPTYRDAVRASHVLGVMLAKLTRHSSLTDGVDATATQNAFVSQQEITPPQDTFCDMLDITSLENLFDNPDMLNWNDIDSYLVDYSGIELPGAVA